MPATYQVERFAGFRDELGSMPQEHQAEADLLDTEFPRIANPAIFTALEATGSLLITTLRIDGALRGYAGGVLANDPQRTRPDGSPVRIFSECGVFVTKAARGYGFGLTRRLEREAIARGAEIIYLRGPTGSRAARFFESLGYRAVETTFAKVVTDAGTVRRLSPTPS